MRIAFLTWRDTTHPDGGGSEVYVEEVARRLAARGHDVTSCAPATRGRRREEVRRRRTAACGSAVGSRVYPRALWLAAHRATRVDVVVDVDQRPALRHPAGAPPRRRRAGPPRPPRAVADHLPRSGRPARLVVESRLTPRLYRGVAVPDGLGGIPPRPRRPSGSRRTRDGRPQRPACPRPRPTPVAEPTPVRAGPAGAPQADRARLRGRRRPCGRGPRAPPRRGRRRLVARPSSSAAARRGCRGPGRPSTGTSTTPTRDRLLGAAWVMLLPSVKEGWGLAVTGGRSAGHPDRRLPPGRRRHRVGLDGVTGLLVDDLDGLVDDPVLLRDDVRPRIGWGARRGNGR